MKKRNIILDHYKKKFKKIITKKIWIWAVGLLGSSTVISVILVAVAASFMVASLVGVLSGASEKNNESSSVVCSGGSISGDKVKTIFERNAKGGALEGKGEFIIKTSEKYKVPPKIAIAIVAMESGWGKGVNATNQKNPFSVMGNGSIHDSVFPTIEAGIEAGIKNLYNLYISQGLTTPEKIGPKYAPVGAINDPENQNANWIPAVKQTVEQLSSTGDKDMTCEDSINIKLSPDAIGSPVDPKLLSRVTCRIGSYSGHPGIDLAIDEGTPVFSMTDGEVTVTVSKYSGGGASQAYFGKDNHITIKSKDNPSIFITYRHLKPGGVLVKTGDKIKAGQKIGMSGNTGYSSGAHLHVEWLKNNVYSISNAIDWYTPLEKKYKVKSAGLTCGI
ncbi:peptidoglycan DD-metalloendopeptidase family protein [Macrococcus capreoli]